MVEQVETRQEVGALQVGTTVSTQSRVIQRGSCFSVRVQLANNGDLPVKLTEWSWTLPPGLYFANLDDPNNDHLLDSTLNPGDSFAMTFPLLANSAIGSLWSSLTGKGGYHSASARTGGYRISINLAFEDASGLVRWREIPSEINIHPSPTETYLAAVLSSLAGSFISFANKIDVAQTDVTIERILTIPATALLAFFLVVIGQRRTDIQFGFAIEDWAGGAILGFMVGYAGSPFVESILAGV